MAKRTAVIDIGSNSARMVVYEKTSRYGFHLIKEIKSRVRVGEGAYEKGGLLQEVPMQRTFDTLKEFSQIIKSLQCRKTLCVATSALRDAPNAKTLTQKIKKELKLNIRIIDGKEEAYFGGLSALNLLAPTKEATTIDIGGGSTELAHIKDGKVVETVSLDIGTVRLKELFYDLKKGHEDLYGYLDEVISTIPPSFNSKLVFGIGGTLRALSSAIMEQRNYPLQTVHGFAYKYEDFSSYIDEMASSSVFKLKSFAVKKDRYDTIREGCAIFSSLAKKLGVESVVSSGAGVREGVYLQDLLRYHGDKFPANFNPSVKSLMDRFVQNPKDNLYVAKKSKELFEVLKPLHGMDDTHKNELLVAAKLYNIGQSLSFYQCHLHGYHFILNNLNFGFTHQEKILIALLIKYNSKKLPKFDALDEYQDILPDPKVVKWLSYILSFAKSLNVDLSQKACSFSYDSNTLCVHSNSPMKLSFEAIKKLVKPTSFAVKFV